MKRLIATILLIIYFVASSGATVQLHYCMDKLVSWGLDGPSTKKCTGCGMDKKGHNGCCHDENKLIKIEKEHKASFLLLKFSYLSLSLIAPLNLNDAPLVSDRVLFIPSVHAPPRASKVPTFLAVCNFRI